MVSLHISSCRAAFRNLSATAVRTELLLERSARAATRWIFRQRIRYNLALLEKNCAVLARFSFFPSQIFPKAVKSSLFGRTLRLPVTDERELWRTGLCVSARTFPSLDFNVLDRYLGIRVRFSVLKMKTP